MNFGVDLFWTGYMAAIFACAAVAAHVYAYARTSRPVKASVKWPLAFIRVAAIGLLVFVLWRPAAETRQILTRRARLAVLLDTSKSMSISDERMAKSEESCSRLARAADVFPASGPVWKEITESYDVAAYSFAKAAAPIAVAPSDISASALSTTRPDGPVTAMGDAIQEVARAVPAPEVIILASDGLWNSGMDPLDVALPTGVTVHAISVGSDQPTQSTRDVAATGIFAPTEVFESSEVNVIGSFSMTGLDQRWAKVSFLVDSQEVETKEIRADRREALVEARFSFKPDKAGPVRLEVRAEPLADEIVSENNSAATYVNVKKGKLKVVYLEGTFRWEAKFLKLTLESAKDIDLRLIVSKGAQDASVASALGGDWDVLVVGDMPAAFFPQEQISAVAEAVAAGKGMLFLGGRNALGMGGYAETPLAPCIPFTVSSDDGLDEKPYRLTPTGLGIYGRLMELGDPNSRELWAKLPPVLSINRTGTPRPGASVPLEGRPVILDPATGVFSDDYTRPPAAVLAVEEYGKGRAAAMAADGTWQWAMGTGLTGSEERDRAASIHKRFWRQLVFWLAKREERGGTSLNLKLARHSIEVGKSLEMEARVLDSDLAPVSDAEVLAQITAHGTTQTVKFWLDGDKYKCEYKPPATGDYQVKAVAMKGAKEIAQAATAFVASATDVELRTLVSRPATLAAIAKATGGRYAKADDAGEVFSHINGLAKQTQYSRVDRRELWSTWWYLAAVIALLSLEWLLRKLAGLV